MALSKTHQRDLDNFIVIWLDPNVNEYRVELEDLTKRLQRFVRRMEICVDDDYCIDYLTNMENEKAILIVCYSLAQQLVSLIKHIPQLSSVYILSENENIQNLSINDNDKVKGIFDTRESLYKTLKEDLYRADSNLMSTNIVSVPRFADLNQLDSSFMYSQLLKEILLKMDYGGKAMHDFIELCLIQEVDNESSHRLIDEFERDYEALSSIWWYTRDCFLYRMLNQALREQNIDRILKMGFFICDLHRQIERLHSCSNNSRPSHVYRGQGMCNAEFDRLRQNIGGLLSFNNFLSTTIDKDIALMRADSAQQNPQLTGILFEIEIDSSISTTPYASLDEISYYRDSEQEILFSTHTIFRIREINYIENRLWEVKLTLTRDTDKDLNLLTDHIRKEIIEQQTPAQLAHLMVKMGEFNHAEEKYKTILESLSNNALNDHASLHNTLGHVMTQQNDLNAALTHLEEGLAIRQRLLPPDHSDLAASYNNIGELYASRGELSHALFHHKKALEIWQKCRGLDQLKLAMSYNNVGEVYRSMGKDSDALLHHQQALNVRQRYLPPTHPDLAMSYNNIGLVYHSLRQFKEALSHLNKALDISIKSLPSTHPTLAITHNNIGEVYIFMGNYSFALAHIRKAMEIQQSLPLNHPDLGTSHNLMGMTHYGMREYPTALTHYRKALEISRESLPPYHPDLNRAHANIGILYHSMADYSSALTHYQKALEIAQRSLPPGHLETMGLQLLTTVTSEQVGKVRSNATYSARLQIQVPEDELD